MKKFMIMLVMFVMAATVAKAQTQVVYWAPSYVILSNGTKWDTGSFPCRLTYGSIIEQEVNIGLQNILLTKGQRAYQEALAYWNAQRPMETGVDISAYVNPLGGGYYGGGYMMGGVGYYGNGTTGVVYSNGSVLPVQSDLRVNEQNMLPIAGSGVQMIYNTGSNSLSISGDPLQAVSRVVNYLGGSGSKKKKSQQSQPQQQVYQQNNNGGANNGNVRVVYVDRQTGQVVGQSAQQTTTRSAQQTTTTRSATPTNSAQQTGSQQRTVTVMNYDASAAW